jgi:hypothetical protein
MFVKLILVAAAAAFVALFGGTDAWARGSKGGHWGGKNSKSMHGMHGKPGHHFPRQAHHSHGKHGHGHDHHLAQGVWHKSSGKSSDSRRNLQAGSSGVGSYGGGGYGESVGDVCINSQFCQGVWYRVNSGSRSSQSSATYQKNGQGDGK